MNKREGKGAADAVWMLIATIVARATMFLINIFTAHLVSVNNFGVYSLVRSTIIFIESLVSSTYGLTVTRKSALSIADAKKIKALFISSVSIVIGFAALVAAIALVFIYPYALQNQHTLVSGGIIGIGIFVLLSVSAATLTQNQVVGMGHYKEAAFGTLAAAITSLTLILLTRGRFSIYLALFAIASYYLTNLLYQWMFVLRKHMSEMIGWSDVKQEVVSGLLESRWLMFGVVINGAAFWLGRILLLRSDDGLLDAAMFDAAFQVLSFIMLFSNSIYSAIFPKMVRRALDGGSPMVAESSDVLKVSLLFVFILVMLVWIFSKQFLSLYGPSYTAADSVLKILAFTGLSFTGALHFNRLMIARERRYHLAVAAVVGAGSMHISYFLVGYNAVGLSVGINAYYVSGLLYYIWNVGLRSVVRL